MVASGSSSSSSSTAALGSLGAGVSDSLAGRGSGRGFASPTATSSLPRRLSHPRISGVGLFTQTLPTAVVEGASGEWSAAFLQHLSGVAADAAASLAALDEEVASDSLTLGAVVGRIDAATLPRAGAARSSFAMRWNATWEQGRGKDLG